MGRPASGKWRAEPRSEPDSGHPTVRDRRGALGDVTHGEPRNPTRKSKERLWSLLAYRCARPGSIPTTRTSGSVGGQGQQRPWSTRPQRATASTGWKPSAPISVPPNTCVATNTTTFAMMSILMAGDSSPAQTSRSGSRWSGRGPASAQSVRSDRKWVISPDGSAATTAVGADGGERAQRPAGQERHAGQRRLEADSVRGQPHQGNS